MVLGITSTASLYVEGSVNPAATLAIVALGCNLAWAIVDGVMYVVTSAFSRSQHRHILHLIKDAPDANEARSIISDRIGREIGGLLKPGELSQVSSWVYDTVLRVKDDPHRTHVTLDDVLGGLACALTVFIATLPALLPLLLIRDWEIALGISNLLTIAALFVVGYSLARYNGGNKWLLGLGLMFVGVILVAITIVLGG